MRRLAIGAALLGLVGMMSSFASADEGYNPPVGDIYLSFENTSMPDKGLTGRYKNVNPFVAFHFYAMLHIDWAQAPYNDPGRNLGDGVSAWEGSVNYPTSLIITERIVPVGHSDFGQDSAGFDNWIVGTGGACVTAGSTPMALVSYGALLSAAGNDLRLSMGAALPSTFDDAGCIICTPQPGFLDCQTPGALYPSNQRWEGHWITINCTTDCVLPAQTQSWGALKSGFSE